MNHLPLHNGGYFNGGKEVSQLEEAVASIGSKTSPVKAITLNIGSNDELAGITQCKDEHARMKARGRNHRLRSGSNPRKRASIPHILKNLGDIIGVIDHVGYTGPIVLLGFYNPDAFVLPGSDALQEGTNAAIEDELLPSSPRGITNVTVRQPVPGVQQRRGDTNSPQNNRAELSRSASTPKCATRTTRAVNERRTVTSTRPSKGYKELAKLVNRAYLTLAEAERAVGAL